jgi:hypothetical protein
MNVNLLALAQDALGVDFSKLARSRASAVRDALKAAGVAEASIEKKPSLFVEISVAGSDAEARRVEISKQQSFGIARKHAG